jgi:hypothetical protein
LLVVADKSEEEGEKQQEKSTQEAQEKIHVTPMYIL